MNNVLEFLKDCKTFYLATCEGDQPRVRPFGAVMIYDGKLYSVTNNKKKVFKQLQENPKLELSGMAKGKWIRVEGIAVHDDNRAARESMLAEYPSLNQMYAVDDGIMEVFYLKDVTATIYSFTGEPEVIKF